MVKRALFGLLVLGMFLITATGIGAEKATSDPAGWRLIWQDEFDGNAPDASKWNITYSGCNPKFGGDIFAVAIFDLEFYIPEAVTVENGLLRIKTQKGDYTGAGVTRPYTSGQVETKGKFNNLYGRYEIRAKMPGGRGVHSTICLRQPNLWPPEITIAEMRGQEPDTVHMSNHWFDIAPHQWLEKSFKGPDFTSDFHIYVVEWEETAIRWVIDGKLSFSMKKESPDVPLYLIINSAVGGQWAGDPDPQGSFPQWQEIDYVRVYERAK